MLVCSNVWEEKCCLREICVLVRPECLMIDEFSLSSQGDCNLEISLPVLYMQLNVLALISNPVELKSIYVFSLLTDHYLIMPKIFPICI